MLPDMPSSFDRYGTDAFDARVIRRAISLSDDGTLVVRGWDVPERYREQATRLLAESAAAWRSRPSGAAGDLGMLAALVSVVIDRDLAPIPEAAAPSSAMSTTERFGTSAFEYQKIRDSLKINPATGALTLDAWARTVPERYLAQVIAIVEDCGRGIIRQAATRAALDAFASDVLQRILREVQPDPIGPISTAGKLPYLDTSGGDLLFNALRVPSAFKYAPDPLPDTDAAMAIAMAATTLTPTRGDMTNESKPSRFSMIAEELTYDPKPRATDVLPGDAPAMRLTAGVPECPRCGCGAFELRAGAIAVCLGCPPPAPSYQVPAGIRMDTARYRCSGCGKQRQVTCALSDVNLHCDGCRGRLALHTRQDPPKVSVSGRAVPSWDGVAPSYQRTPEDFAISDLIVDLQRDTAASNNYGNAEFINQILGRWMPVTDAYAKAERAALSILERDMLRMQPVTSETPFEVTKARISDMMRFVAVGLEVPVDPEPAWNGRGSFDADAVDRLARALAIEIGLVGFEEYALRRVGENRRAGVGDVARRTGRTWRGLLNAIARCRLEGATVISVHAASAPYELELRRTAVNLAGMLEDKSPCEYPLTIMTLSPETAQRAEEDGRDTLGRRVVVYRDHYRGKEVR